MKNKILVWLPAYNEEVNIIYMIDALNEAGYDFVVCNGYSSDNTAQLAKEHHAVIVERSGHGKGHAVSDGLDYCVEHGYEGMLLIDCDRTYAIEDIPRLIALFEKHDMIVGCRSLKDIGFFRSFANRVMTLWMNVLFSAKSKDMASGLRLLRVSKFVGKLSARSFDIEPEMHCLALGNKYRIAEVDISYSMRHGNSKVSMLHFFLLMWRIWQVSLRF